MSLYCYCKLTGRSCIFYFLKSHLKFWKRWHRALSSRSLKLSKTTASTGKLLPCFTIHCKEYHPCAGSELPSLRAEGGASSCKAPRGIWRRFLCRMEHLCTILSSPSTQSSLGTLPSPRGARGDPMGSGGSAALQLTWGKSPASTRWLWTWNVLFVLHVLPNEIEIQSSSGLALGEPYLATTKTSVCYQCNCHTEPTTQRCASYREENELWSSRTRDNDITFCTLHQAEDLVRELISVVSKGGPVGESHSLWKHDRNSSPKPKASVWICTAKPIKGDLGSFKEDCCL